MNLRDLSNLLLLVPLVLGQSNFRCPEPTGTFEDPVQCDKYYECRDGIAEEHLCLDGLVFDPYSRKREPCDHYFNVDCGGRLELQPPQGKTDFCPRLHGYYAHPDPGVCHIFFSCTDGLAEEYTCSSGLWFDEYTGYCNWPEATDRTECRAGAYALDTTSGFQCPEKAPVDAFGQADPHPKFEDPDDCAKFYICLNGISPREQGCPLGEVYNIEKGECDAPENVPECKDYYAFLDDDDTVVVNNKARK